MGLYDPGEHPTEFPAEVVSDFTVQDVLAWARTKPAGEEYCYFDTGHCAIAQFGRETLRPYLIGVHYEEFSEKWPALEEAAVRSPQTFGAFADRLAKLSA